MPAPDYLGYRSFQRDIQQGAERARAPKPVQTPQQSLAPAPPHGITPAWAKTPQERIGELFAMIEVLGLPMMEAAAAPRIGTALARGAMGNPMSHVEMMSRYPAARVPLPRAGTPSMRPPGSPILEQRRQARAAAQSAWDAQFERSAREVRSASQARMAPGPQPSIWSQLPRDTRLAVGASGGALGLSGLAALLGRSDGGEARAAPPPAPSVTPAPRATPATLPRMPPWRWR